MSNTKHDDEGEGPIPGLRALRDVTPPPSFVPAVMRRVAEPRPVSFWSWLRRPRRFELRLSPLGATACVAAGAVLASLALVGGSSPGGRSHTPSAAVEGPAAPAVVATALAGAPAPEVVLVRFVLMAKGAKKVAVAGSFNGWNAETTALEDSEGRGIFVATVPLARGAHEYMFIVDGEWISDPAASERRPDGFGRNNAVLRL